MANPEYRNSPGPSSLCETVGLHARRVMPVAELPSILPGIPVTGFYAPTSRYGTPADFQFLVNALHEPGSAC